MRQNKQKLSPAQIERLFAQQNDQRHSNASGDESQYDGLKPLHEAPKIKSKGILTDKGKKVLAILALAGFFYYLYTRSKSQMAMGGQPTPPPTGDGQQPPVNPSGTEQPVNQPQPE